MKRKREKASLKPHPIKGPGVTEKKRFKSKTYVSMRPSIVRTRLELAAPSLTCYICRYRLPSTIWTGLSNDYPICSDFSLDSSHRLRRQHRLGSGTQIRSRLFWLSVQGIARRCEYMRWRSTHLQPVPIRHVHSCICAQRFAQPAFVFHLCLAY